MKYCVKCGKQIDDEAVICIHCGRMIGNLAFETQPATVATGVKSATGLQTAAKIFMILSTVLTSIFTFGIALAWCLPMTLSYCKRTENNLPVSTGFKVCTLLFVNTIAGILMLCDNR